MKKSWVLIAIVVVIVVVVFIYQQRTSPSRGLRVIEAKELSKLKDQPAGPVLIRYSMEQWREMTKEIATIKQPLPQTNAQLAFFPVPEPDLPPHDIIVRPRCQSSDPNVVCFPQITFGPTDEVVFKGCTCFPAFEERDEEPRPEPEVKTFSCKWIFRGAGGFYCEGNCTEKGDCEEKVCVSVRNSLFPGVIVCDCAPASRPVAFIEPDRR